MRKITCLISIFIVLCALAGCGNDSPPPRIGISLGVGEAARWPKELAFMLARAKERGMIVEARLNKTDTPKTQLQDCKEMVDSGIAVLILTPRDVRKADDIVSYAKSRNVKVISYARAVMKESVDLFVGHDLFKIGQNLGRHLTEKVYQGDLIILKGDENDTNSQLLHYGSQKYVQPLVQRGDLRLLLEAYVPGWSAAIAKELVRKAIVDNGNKVDAIFAHNDLIAEVCAEVLEELGISRPVLITGMDAELSALQRIVAGQQEVTVYLDYKDMAHVAVDEAYNMATRKKISVNSAFDNEGLHKIDAYLINGKMVTRENLDKLLIAPGHFNRQDVYGHEATRTPR